MRIITRIKWCCVYSFCRTLQNCDNCRLVCQKKNQIFNLIEAAMITEKPPSIQFHKFKMNSLEFFGVATLNFPLVSRIFGYCYATTWQRSTANLVFGEFIWLATYSDNFLFLLTLSFGMELIKSTHCMETNLKHEVC